MPDLVFFVPGDVVAQGSKVVIEVRGHRPMLADDNAQKLRPWRKRVAQFANQATVEHARQHETPDLFGARLWRPLDVAEVGLAFYLERPKTVTRARPSVAPDLDKLARAVFDALTVAQVVHDDAGIVGLLPGTGKWYADAEHPAGVMITVREV